MAAIRKYPYKDLPGLNNIEVEKPETIHLPNGELYQFKDKTHKQDGEDIYAPDGSKIFSHKQKSPKELTETLTGKKFKKKKSFAEISAMYDPSPYKDMLDDKLKRYDPLSLRTAELMFNKMNGHLEDTFYGQEAYKASKGMKNDANNLEQQLLTKLENGGRLPKAQNGTNVHGINSNFTQDLRGINNAQLGFFPEYYNNVETDGSQRFDGNYYGGISLNNDNYNYAKYYAPNQEFQDFMQDSVYTPIFNQQYDFDLGDGTRDYQRGNITNVAPVPVYGTQGSKTGSISWQQYRDNPDAVAQEYGLTRQQLDNYFSQDKLAHTLNVTRRPTQPVQATPPTPRTPYALNSSPINRPDTATPTNEYNNAMDVSDMLKFGMGLSDMATLRRSNPYYSYSPVKPALQRHYPINTMQNERVYSTQANNINRMKGYPESVKSALLNQNMSALQKGINEVNINNYANDNQVDNANSAAIVNAFNQNSQLRENANRQYFVENARGKELYNATKSDLKSRLVDLLDDRNYRNYTRKLDSELSDNFYLGKDGMPRFIKGSTPSPTTNNPLRGYNTTEIAQEAKEAGITEKQLTKLMQILSSYSQ